MDPIFRAHLIMVKLKVKMEFYIYPDGSYKRGRIVNGKLEGIGRFVSRSGNFMY
jgi:hypothetical protein